MRLDALSKLAACNGLLGKCETVDPYDSNSQYYAFFRSYEKHLLRSGLDFILGTLKLDDLLQRVISDLRKESWVKDKKDKKIFGLHTPIKDIVKLMEVRSLTYATGRNLARR